MEDILTRNKLPIWATVSKSYSYVFNNLKQFVLPILIIFSFTLSIRFVCANIETSHWSLAFNWIAELFVFLLPLPLTIAIYRMILLNEKPINNFSLLRIDKQLLNYMGALLVVFLPIIVIEYFPLLLIFNGISVPSHPVIKALLLLAAINIIIRLSLSFPAIATSLEMKQSFLQSWDSTRGNVFRLLLVIFLTMLPAIVLTLSAIIFWVTNQIMQIGHQPLTQVSIPFAYLATQSALGSIYIPITTVMAALCYDVLVRGKYERC